MERWSRLRKDKYVVGMLLAALCILGLAAGMELLPRSGRGALARAFDGRRGARLTFEDFKTALAKVGDRPVAVRFAASFRGEPKLRDALEAYRRSDDFDAFARTIRSSPEFSRLVDDFEKEPGFKDLVEDWENQPALGDRLKGLLGRAREARPGGGGPATTSVTERAADDNGGPILDGRPHRPEIAGRGRAPGEADIARDVVPVSGRSGGSAQAASPRTGYSARSSDERTGNYDKLAQIPDVGPGTIVATPIGLGAGYVPVGGAGLGWDGVAAKSEAGRAELQSAPAKAQTGQPATLSNGAGAGGGASASASAKNPAAASATNESAPASRPMRAVR